MALVSLGAILEYPMWPIGIRDSNTSPGALSTLNDALDTYAVTLKILEAGTIDKVHFRIGSSTGTDTLRISIQGVTAEGWPDGSDTHFRDYVQTGSEDNTVIETGLMTDTGGDGGAKKVVAVGDKIAIVITYNIFTSGSVQLTHFLTASDFYGPSAVWFDSAGSTFTISNNLQANPTLFLEYNDGTFPYQPHSVPYETATNHTVDDADTPDEFALRIIVPFPCRAAGIFIKGGNTNITAILYDAASSILGGGAITPEMESTTQLKVQYYYFATPVTLTKDLVYRIAWKPGVASNILNTWDMPNAAMRQVLPNGLNMQLSSRVDAGSWTDIPAEMMCAGLLLDQLDGGALGGDVFSPPILTPIKSGGHVIY
jgi:hypothetical protein